MSAHDEGPCEHVEASRYYKLMADELSGQLAQLEARVIRLTHETAARRAGFEILARLFRSVGSHSTLPAVLSSAVEAVTKSLRMDRTIILERRSDDRERFRPVRWLGLPDDVSEQLATLDFTPPTEVASGEATLLVNGTTAPTPFIQSLRDAFGVNFLVCTAIASDADVVGLLVAGRLSEMKLFRPSLDDTDVDTLCAIAQFLGVVMENVRKSNELRRQIEQRSQQLSEALARLDREGSRSQAPRHAPDGRGVRPGDLIDGRYRIIASLGEGGMGVVYEVERPDGQRLALKVLHGAGTTAQLARFAREAQITAKLAHPHLVRIHDVGVTVSGTLFFVTELVRGTTLAAERARYGDLAWALPLLAQIASGLAAIHQAEIAHRDLKPANILLSRSANPEAYTVKIADFGIATDTPVTGGAATLPLRPRTPHTTVGASSPPPAGEGLTANGVVMGTPLYMAPELADGAVHASTASDIWSFGVVASELLTSRFPFDVAPFLALHHGHSFTTMPVATLRTDLDARLAALLDACLAHGPARRPPASEVLWQLERAMAPR